MWDVYTISITVRQTGSVNLSHEPLPNVVQMVLMVNATKFYQSECIPSLQCFVILSRRSKKSIET